MRFVLFVEGDTEEGVCDFLLRWLAPPRIPKGRRVGITSICFHGWSSYHDGIAKKAAIALSKDDVIGGIGLLDLYGPPYPETKRAVAERYRWAKEALEKKVGHPKFRQHFAVHETEAWLLADPKILPREVAGALPARCKRPETVNFDEPPAKLLERLYRTKASRYYRKRLDGIRLLQKLSPEQAAEKCPFLKLLLDDMLELARQAAG
ncbi:MAG TPA: DUF4276 family protein [Thermoanaerobaculia bacterium]|jgi:hypothetical protein|nr:DUF4276 family protein [Thermoanaerobaculia bacterium]